uniref:Uncharacterized protein n=1 Tax=Arundo donax TaxID=35708 RepID=A0A0A8Y4M7_ARUDO
MVERWDGRWPGGCGRGARPCCRRSGTTRCRCRCRLLLRRRHPPPPRRRDRRREAPAAARPPDARGSSGPSHHASLRLPFRRGWRRLGGPRRGRRRSRRRRATGAGASGRAFRLQAGAHRGGWRRRRSPARR